MRYFIYMLIFIFFGCVNSEVQNDNVISEEAEDFSDSSNSSNDSGESPITWDECSHAIGDHPCDFTLYDHNGLEFNLYDNYGDVIVLDFSTMWCYYCKVAAQNIQEHQDAYEDQGFIYVTVLIEDEQGGDVDEGEAKAWADSYGITTAPVLIGDRSFIDMTATTGYPISGWPTFVVINREMVIHNGVNGYSEELVIRWVEESL